MGARGVGTRSAGGGRSGLQGPLCQSPDSPVARDSPISTFHASRAHGTDLALLPVFSHDHAQRHQECILSSLSPSSLGESKRKQNKTTNNNDNKQPTKAKQTQPKPQISKAKASEPTGTLCREEVESRPVVARSFS
ncbi:hypothetical protein PAL_GLEAN10004739 [Pteropus alecto]|uniref:Uncharacterized protein n=1 Tax=Pteropus alecto TaxID=9402 RepID=L5KC25_PTEAL|nr:hypothetical protein PAL_GLEAN10004739 [Pteropus alecto]